MWRALDVFTEGDRSTTADIRKNLIAIVFNSHFLSMSELLIEPRTAQILYMISANKTTSGQDPFVILYLSVSELGKYILKQEKNFFSSGLNGISNQLLKLSLPYVITRLHMFLIYASRKTFFHLRPKWFRFQKAKLSGSASKIYG